MSHRQLKKCFDTFKRDIDRCRRLIQKAEVLNQGRVELSLPAKQFHMIAQLAFLQGYLAWEAFLEDTFMLYLLGKSAPSGFCPHRFALPLSRSHAIEFAGGDSRRVDWTAADLVISRAQRCFRRGNPYFNALRPRTNFLNDLKTLRNATAHASGECKDKFKSLVRRELAFFPSGLSVGAFLISIKPNLLPPISFLDYYFDTIQDIASEIVPS